MRKKKFVSEPGMGTSCLDCPPEYVDDTAIGRLAHPSDAASRHKTTEPIKPFDPVDKPKHYMVAGVEVRDIQKELSVGFMGQEASDFNNAVKYLLRSPKKGKLVEDLKKCRKHITWLIESFGGDDAED